jgi:hypothetical protein
MSGAISATTLGIIGLTAAAGTGVAGAVIGSKSGEKAADTQAAAANNAAQLQADQSQKALDFQKEQYATTQAQQAPWLQAGQTALGQLSAGTAPGGSLMQPYGQQFQAPTGLTEINDPGYQARLKLGTDAMQRSAAARGSVLTGGTAKALNQFGQDYASNEYGNVYNRALSDYTTKYNAYNQDQGNQYNRLASLAGVGQTAANQLASQGQAASSNVSQNLLQTGQLIGNNINNAGAATASGYVNSGSNWAQGLSGIGNNITDYTNNQLRYAQNPYLQLQNLQQRSSALGPASYASSPYDTSLLGYVTPPTYNG